MSGLVYLLFQLRGNIWSGGTGFFAYRYAIEPLFLSTLLLAPSIASLAQSSATRRRVVSFTVKLSIGIQLVGSIVG